MVEHGILQHAMNGGYYKTKESVEEYIRLSKDVSGQLLIDKLLKILAINSRLLEIGSGPGTDWKILSESYEVIGSDYSNEFLDVLKRVYPDGQFLKLDAITLNTTKTFDGIYSNKVLQHLTNEELLNSIARQHELLSDQGIICHSFWKGEGSEIFKGLFVNYHQQDYLKQTFKNYFEK